ncbi:MAG: hypothetical protein RQ723_01650 [Desulfuromonadales bacterium]|nr:hypothetical protein [Desulfuromonadales bacterium]
MAEPERCYCLHRLPATPPADGRRLYFGAEFCFWRLPAESELLAAVDWCRRFAWAFTLVTPVLNQGELDRLGVCLRRLLPRLAAGDELLVSDWGAIAPARQIRADLPIVLGRALSAQKRDPLTASLDLSPAELDVFRHSAWHNRAATELLAELGIGRVELDSPVQGLAPLPAPLHGTLHAPYAMVTSSRNCPFRPVPAATPCPAPCGETFRLTSVDGSRTLLQSGNTQFAEQHLLPENLAALGIDRLVIHSQLPR